MRIEEELAEFAPQQDTVLAVGVFDGVHLGHQHVMDYLKRQALARECLAGVVTFRNHPLHVLSPETHLLRLTNLEDRIRFLHALGIELVVPISFTPELAQLPVRDFVALLQNHLRMQELVVGPDFAMGRSREGNVAALHSLGKEMGFWVDVVRPKLLNGEVVSSTCIRQALAQGDMSRVKRLLGRPHSLSGQIGHGEERGRQLGFPTANLEVNSGQSLPSDGVYATKAYLGSDAYPSVTNIGTCPTFGEGGRTVEIHLLDFEGALYEQDLRVELIERLRPEKCFSDPEELKAQIGKDVEQARSILEKTDK